MPTEQERFWAKVDKRGPNECWPWTAAKVSCGYGDFRLGSARGFRHQHAQRFSWELHNGPVPARLEVMHRCDNPPCVNPAHLVLGTHADNMRDRDRKGRTGWPGHRPTRTAREGAQA